MIAENFPTKSSRIEIEQNGHVGYLAYELDDDGWMTLVHTVVPAALQGHGIGGKLVEKAYANAREHGWKVQLICPFAVNYVAKHPELQPFTGVKG
jgi:predicted GNAT family acetyltransferase